MSRTPKDAIVLVFTLVLSLCLLFAGPLLAQSAVVPAHLQAELLAKLAPYDRNFPKRARGVAKVVALVKPGEPSSSLSASAMRSAVANIQRIAGLAVEVSVRPYTNAPELAQICRTEGIAIVYVTPGFDSEIHTMSVALSDVDVLTVSPVPSYVEKGIVLGFELVSGRAKILLNLEQARKQHVDFASHVLKLMRVYR